MKKYALSLLLIVLPLALLAEPVSLQRARRLADTFMAADGTRAGSLQLTCSYDVDARVLDATRTAGDPALYVFNRPGGGFVLVSGDDAFRPVLGYSYTGEFCESATMPENLRGWLEEMTAAVGDIRANHLKANSQVADEWDKYESPTRAGSLKKATPVKLYTTAEWAQGDPYNRFTPAIGGKQTVTGCVATSIGILMKYYGYPQRIKIAQLPARSGDGYTIPYREVDYDYQWDKMLMKYSGSSYTDEQADACARLLADIGQIGDLSYGTSTGGNTKDVLGLMVNYYGYDPGMINESRYYYSDDEWIAKLKAELDQRPMSYTGRSSTGGHAFVADGYDTADYIHINWGWNGSSNGYYHITGFYKYTSKHAATFGFRPAVGGTYQPLYAFYVGTTSAGVAYKGLEMVSSGITPGKSFNIKVGGIINKSFVEFPAEVAIGHCDQNGTLKGIVSTSKMDVSNLGPDYWRGYESVTCKITLPLETGDLLKAFYRVNNGEWQPLKADKNVENAPYSELRIADHLSIEAATNMLYDKTAGTLTFTMKLGTQVIVESASKASVSQYVTNTPGTLVLRIADMPKDTYIITLSSATESKVLRIVR